MGLDPSRIGESQSPSIGTIVKEWGRLGCIGFGGPPTHVKLLRRLCVDQHQWIDADAFEDGITATNLLPGPASTQLAIYCAWRLRGAAGAIAGGLCFIAPGLAVILALSSLFLSSNPPTWVLGAAAGAGAAVPAVALSASWGLAPSSWRRAGTTTSVHVRWVLYALVGGVIAATVGTYLVLGLLTCGVVEILVRRPTAPGRTTRRGLVPLTIAHTVVAGGIGAVAWVALKVGALSYGGGFVIVPLMQHDAVVTYHWMTGAQFLNAVALGQVTPGPVVQTVAVVGYAAGGLWAGLLAASIAFAPSFVFVLTGASHFEQIRANTTLQAFLSGAGPAVIGAIGASAIPLGRALQHPWQVAVLVGAVLLLFVARRGVVSTLLLAGGVGVAVALCGVSVR